MQALLKNFPNISRKVCMRDEGGLQTLIYNHIWFASFNFWTTRFIRRRIFKARVSGLRQCFRTEIHLKIMINAFYFTLK